jgi:tRNA threonylcarbamoyladenosine biosynthesis protein TsaB
VGKLLLAIDTATRMASLALHDGARVRIELTWETADHHTIELTPRIVEMCAQVKASMDDLAGVAVAIGPGSFTGVRVGVALAKGLCIARSLPLYGVRTFDILAQAQPPSEYPLVVILQAGRARLCAARYVWQSAGWHIDGEIWLTSAQMLGQDWEGVTVVCGELTANERHTLQTRLGSRIRLAAPAASLRRAGFLAEMGWSRLWHGQADDAATLVPIYIQTPGSPGVQ